MTILSEVKEFICNNNFDLVLDAIDGLEGDEIILGKIVKSKILGDRGNFSRATSVINEILAHDHQGFEVNFGTIMSLINLYWKQAKYDWIPELIIEGDTYLQYIQDEKSDFTLWFMGQYFNGIGNYYWDKGELSLALQNYNKSLEIRKELGITIEIAKSINNLGNIHYIKGEYDLALNKYEENLNLKRKIGPNTDLSAALSNIGAVYHDKGQLSNALRYYIESIDSIVRSKSNDSSAIAFRYVDIGSIYTLKGNLNSALTYFYEAKSIYEHINNQFQLGRTLGNIGIVWYYKNDQQKAEKFLKQSLYHLNRFENDFEISISLYRMILVKLAQKSLLEASEYLDSLRIISNKSDSEVVKLRYQLAKAIIYQNQPRLISKVNASDLFAKILKDPLFTELIKNEARIGICDLLISEYEVLNNDDLYSEINDLIGSIYKYGQEEEAFPSIIKALEFKARMAYCNHKYLYATRLFDIAEFYADERELELEKDKIQRIKNKLNLIAYRWGKVRDLLMESKKSIINRGDDQAILDYLEDLKKFKFDTESMDR